jgi:hypothetical protein
VEKYFAGWINRFYTGKQPILVEHEKYMGRFKAIDAEYHFCKR